MTLIITVLHIMVSLALIFVVLLQKGSGADMGAAFGGSSQGVFGARGSGGFLTRMTAVLATVFMLTSLSLAFFTTRSGPGVSVMEKAPVAQSAPAAPSGPPIPAKSAAGAAATAPAAAKAEKPIPVPSSDATGADAPAPKAAP